MTKPLFALLVTCIVAGAMTPVYCAEPLQPIFKVAPGFAVERVYVVPRDSQGSWISLCADRRGNLYASDQYGPLYVIRLPAETGGEVTAHPIKLPIGGVHGLSWVGKDLYAVVGQRDICEPGLYRLRDTDGDGDLDAVQQLRPLGGDGEHGPHALVASADGQSLFVIAGNAAPLPNLTRSRVPKLWREDSLLPPLPALMGSETKGLPHGGWICRTDLEGREWELICLGLRNAYSLACDRSGELLTFDSDTELEIGLPWYRPTRVLHCVSGADFGWRRGALKVPDGAPDTVPPLLTMGLGSPTAVLFGTGAAFPARYRDALYVADWCYGRLRAVHLRARGSGFAAESEEILAGMPLPITAACVNPQDGGLYFVTGGRKTQSALYRLTWRGSLAPADQPTLPDVNKDVEQRHALEAFHGRIDARAVDAAWPHLNSDDPLLRHAARVALEFQPVDLWQERALAESRPRAALAALLALARAGDARLQPRLLHALEAMDWQQLGPLRSEWLRVTALAFIRGGGATSEIKQHWAKLLSPSFPSDDRTLDGQLCELLVYLGAPDIAAKAVAQLSSVNTQEQQLHYARCLRTLETGWTPELRGQFFDWLGRASDWHGGGSFAVFVQRLRTDSLAATPADQRASFEQRMVAARPPPNGPVFKLPPGRGLVKEWNLDELVALAEPAKTPGNAQRGRHWFNAIGCAACHTFAGEGGAVGMDLTAVAGRLSTRDLLESIVDPSKEISDQYGSIVLLRRDGSQVQGRIVNYSPGVIQISENLFDPSAITKVPENDVETITRSKTSLMPAGMLNVLQPGEIVDLVAYLKSGLNRPSRPR